MNLEQKIYLLVGGLILCTTLGISACSKHDGESESSSVMSGLKQQAGDLTDSASKRVAEGLEAGSDTLSGSVESARDKLASGAEAVSEKTRELGEQAKDKAGELKQQLQQTLPQE